MEHAIWFLFCIFSSYGLCVLCTYIFDCWGRTYLNWKIETNSLNERSQLCGCRLPIEGKQWAHWEWGSTEFAVIVTYTRTRARTLRSHFHFETIARMKLSQWSIWSRPENSATVSTKHLSKFLVFGLAINFCFLSNSNMFFTKN